MIELTPESEWVPPRTWTMVRVAVLVALMSSIVATGVFLWVGTQSVRGRLAAMRAQGLPTTAGEINAFYVIPKGVTDCTQAWIAVGVSAETAGSSEAASNLPILGKNCADCVIPPPGETWDKLEDAERFLKDNAELIESIRQAASIRGQVRFPVDFNPGVATLLPDNQRMRGIARILELDAEVSAHRGDSRRVLLDIKNILSLSEAMRGEPMVISQLIRYALNSFAISLMEKLAPHCDWTDEELQSLQEDLRRLTIEVDMQRALVAETAIILNELEKAPLGPLRIGNQQLLLDTMEEIQAAYGQPWPALFQQQSAAVTKLKTRTQKSFLSSRYAILSLMTPSLEQLGRATGRNVAKRRLATIALACHRYHRLHSQWPESVGQLDSSLLGELPDALTDPFTGQPFPYIRDDAGWQIYSTDSDETDDHGNEKKDIPLRIKFNRP